ncbi:MAG: tRNA 2-thiouridine(34) synthase MnmA [Elusimicrobiota bacterium]
MGTTHKHIVVAMSGGVDSSVAAALLHEQGHRVIGVTLRLLKKETGFGCCGSTRDIDDARDVCARLGVPHYVLDFSGVFKDNIMDPFVRAYAAGETPNPCIACNRFVKFDALLAKAVALGADAVATGHYARASSFQEGDATIYRLHRAADAHKDQSYVLYNLRQAQLARILFPLGELTKPAVRDIARRWNLKTADKPDSQEICFVPGADAAAYLESQFQESAARPSTARPGDIRDTAGRVLGTHKGVAFYTRGQRQGLGLSLGKPAYIVDLDVRTNTVVVGSDEETLSESFWVRDLSWVRGAPPAPELDARVKIRSRHEPAPCRIQLTDGAPGQARVTPAVPQRAVTPGQAAVFYAGDEVLGGGAIKLETETA